MSGHLTPEAQQRIMTDRFHPLRDKTLNETYFPGSTFKAVSALAALEDKLVTPEERTKCHGSYEIGRRRFHCTKTHGVVALYDAIVQSCNVYFYELGARPGMMDRLAKYGADMGLGAPTGLGINGEEGGFIPPRSGTASRSAEPEGRGLPGGAVAERRHRAGLDARHVAADGDDVRGHRERRKARGCLRSWSASSPPRGR